MKDYFNLQQETHPERLFAISNLGNRGVIYDLGCGTNKTVPEAIGVDVRVVTDVVASIDNLPFGDNTGNVIISRHSLEHVLDPVKTIREWLRVLKQDGRIIIVLPDHGSINTLDPYYSAGQHLHAYSMESFRNFISVFPELYIQYIGVVLDEWSFGVVLKRLPSVSIIIPTLGRPEGLMRCLNSIGKLDYPKNLVEIHILDGEGTVPQKVADGFQQSKGEYIIYAANDMEFLPDTLRIAIAADKSKGLVAFHEGDVYPDEGNICTHFAIHRNLVADIGGEIFDTEFHHVGVDNLLWAKAKKMGRAIHSNEAKINHYHFSKGAANDEVYQKGWSKLQEDRELLKKKLAELENTP